MACGSHDSSVRVSTDSLVIKRCRKCSLHFAIHPPKATKEYYADFSLDDYMAYYGPFRRRIFRQNWADFQKIFAKGKALDFGASFGWFLAVAPASWQATGIEQSALAIAHARSQNLDVRQGDEQTLSALKDTYDLITLWNVVEHLPRPDLVLSQARKLLAPHGLIALSFPNRKGLINQAAYWAYALSGGRVKKPLFTLFQVGIDAPHLFHYSASDMERLLTAAGFKVLTVKGQPIVDLKNLAGRIKLESGSTSGFKQVILNAVTLAMCFCSALLRLPDEIVVYAQKTEREM